MKIDRTDILKVLRAFDESDWDTIHLSADRVEFFLTTVAGNHPPTGHAPAPTLTASAADAVALPPAERTPAPAAPQPTSHSDGITVTAPSVGRFYRAPSPGAPPFVEVGDDVTPDTTVGIVEVMKLMNPIKAGVAGRIVAILAENAANVTRGEPLLIVVPPDALPAT